MPRQYALPFVPFTQVELTCQQCGVRYEVSKQRLASSRYCSRACSRAAWSALAQVSLVCEVCGTGFTKTRSYIRYQKTPIRVCSKPCLFVLRRGARGDHAARFWARVDKNGPPPENGAEHGNCWTRGGLSHGYSTFWDGAKLVRGTHYAWFLASGQPVPAGMSALHVCDYTPCVRADGEPGLYVLDGISYERRGHLWLGDRSANGRDRHTKGRTRTKMVGRLGESNPVAKLNDETVRAIRREHAEGITVAALSRRYGRHEETVRDVVKRKTWRHVE